MLVCAEALLCAAECECECECEEEDEAVTQLETYEAALVAIVASLAAGAAYITPGCSAKAAALLAGAE